MASSEDLSLFVPFILGLSRTDPDRESEPEPEPGSGRERIILINPLTQGLVVIEGVSGLLREVSGKKGPPPAAEAAIEAIASVEIGGDGGEECPICLEEYEVGGVVKEMPCEHRFHGGCVERWLRVHGSCPVCRYKMPVDEPELGKRTSSGREIWVSFAFNGVRRSGGDDESGYSSSSD